MKKLISTNPAKNYEEIGSVNITSEKKIKQKVDAAQKAKKLWKELGVAKRIKMLRPLYNDFIKRKKEIALLTTKEIGKPIKEALEDTIWDQNYFEDFLLLGEKYLADEITYQDKKQVHKIIYEPIGVTAVIVPWNYPWANFLWGVIPNLIAGNTVVFKHSEECPLMGKLIDEMMEKIQVPKGVFSQVYGDGKVGEMLVNQHIDFVWFTGSSHVGKRLYEIAGKKFIKAVMELGGSNPGIVFEDVVLNIVINKIYLQRFANCGQVCDALKRLIVSESVFDEVVEKLKLKLNQITVGNPEDIKTDIGPLVAKRQLELLQAQVKDAVKKGAKVITGGKRSDGLQGAFYLPTILTNIKRDMRVWKEETFGPVLTIIPFKTEKEAIQMANDTPYGLGAFIYSSDKKRALKVASQLESGDININMGDHWKVCTPFGGYKASGIGREHGAIGFRELCQIKVIAINN